MKAALLAVWLSAVELVISDEAASRLGHRVVATAPSPHGVVQVVDLNTSPPIRYLLAGKAILGAKFIGKGFEDATPFVNFAVQMAAAHLVPRPGRALMLGLGAGTVPRYLERHGLPTDVVEINGVLAEHASKYFGYNRSKTLRAQGSLFIEDAYGFLFQRSSHTVYDVVIHDLFAGDNPCNLLTVEVLEQIKKSWLASFGMLIVNVVGFINTNDLIPDSGEALTIGLALLRTLRTAFTLVYVFREMPLDMWQDKLTNLIFFATDGTLEFDLPSDIPAAELVEMSPEWVMRNFQTWNVAPSLARAATEDLAEDSLILTSQTSSHLCSKGQQVIKSAMWHQVKDDIPATVWAKAAPTAELTNEL